ncbi:hypothetical protein GFC01_00785 [Desulfofundulus thermobenzoicus]|uniref:Uncharacterized protein n=1 Tax=Desulfofundulus thermobenzoicus TaxID=29376 RepID=A0A6N7ILK3_9FIRM|nr:hypothetical protein [Desulfofundulus thermobenzoicus]MQL50835.1 hypothetical protein [Desulfofundulus thermobenzoicus]
MGSIIELQKGDKAAWKELNTKLEALTSILNDIENRITELSPYVEKHASLMQQYEKIKRERDNVIATMLMAVRRR